jgi:hypothetical protein
MKCGALQEDEAQRLKALEQENSRLKKIVAEQALDISLLKDLQREWRLEGHRVPPRPRASGRKVRVRPPTPPGTWPPRLPSRSGRNDFMAAVRARARRFGS